MPADRVNAAAPVRAGAPGMRWCRGLYAITPACADDAQLLHLSRAVLDGGAAMLQYRGKQDSAVDQQRRAVALRALCREHGVPFIVNDDVALAAAVHADGVHLGQADGSIADARRQLGANAIIGASCYDDGQRAIAARDAGASYVAFGAFFASPTKPQALRADPSLLRDSADLGIPRVAIGGIRVDNALPLLAAGADMLAVIGDLFAHPDPRARSAQFAALFAARTSLSSMDPA